MSFSKPLPVLSALLSSTILLGSLTAHADEKIHADTPRIQIALLLDTSNSMDGLINQAKSQLWTLVNELSEGKKDGQTPRIEIALYEYGNDSISVSQGYVRQVLSLTHDLDAVSEKLFALSTNGGQEYAGQVILNAATDLEWSQDKDDMKLMIIAGNEPFTQGPVRYESACARAKSGGIIIDTIHCGDEQTGVETGWKAGADCAGGIYMVINQDEKSVHIPSPYDDKLNVLNQKLNDTYIGYGAQGATYKRRQMEQDVNAAAMSPKASIARLKSKSSSSYSNESWDLVDAYKENEEKITALPDDDLPDELKGKSKAERAAFIEAKAQERRQLQKEITALSEKQKAFVDDKRKDMAHTKTLDTVMVRAIRDQATQSGFSYAPKS
ncbi:MAG TPA: VWA domain-containing protein [Hellea balneolensis]|uniref:VWA domain-containing protein n=1 Tax=Hellea balneolensis TaxID=287478 RepID=A0A7C3C4L9_9PROT|nr:VWA domain-containing protein [Hellea balneolensis]